MKPPPTTEKPTTFQGVTTCDLIIGFVRTFGSKLVGY